MNQNALKMTFVFSKSLVMHWSLPSYIPYTSTGNKISNISKHAGFRRMQSSGKSNDNSTGAETRGTRSPTRVLVQLKPSKREDRETRLLVSDSCRQIRDPLPAEVLRKWDAWITKSIHRSWYLGNIRHLLQPKPQKQSPKLHCSKHGRYTFHSQFWCLCAQESSSSYNHHKGILLV